MFWVEGYWEASGEAGIKAIERAIKILNSVPIPRLKEMYDFITEGKREDAFFRAIRNSMVEKRRVYQLNLNASIYRPSYFE
jgi:hypothetical protein